jgi:hypothetical protein
LLRTPGYYEECIALQPGERIGYRFNVEPQIASTFTSRGKCHHHAERDSHGEETGDFVADRAQAYCLMWEAGPAPAVLNYRVQPLPARQ